MSNEKQIVPATQTVVVTPAQKQLLELLDPLNAAAHLQSLKLVHRLGTYFADKDLVDLYASYQVSQLIDSITSITSQFNTTEK